MDTTGKGRGKSPGSRTTQFGAGNDGNVATRRAKAEAEAAKPVPRLLRDMRHVYDRPKEKDKTPGHTLCRKWLNDDPKGFLTHLNRLERAYAVGQEKVSREKPREAKAEDVGEEKALELLERCLGDYHRQQCEEGARLAAQPGTAALAGELQRALQQSTSREGLLQKEVEELRQRVKGLELRR